MDDSDDGVKMAAVAPAPIAAAFLFFSTFLFCERVFFYFVRAKHLRFQQPYLRHIIGG